jgi:hypothetical protein
MRQFVNVLQAVGAPTADAGQALLNQNLRNYGTCSLFLGLSLKPAQCKQLFIDGNGKPRDSTFYIDAMCAAERIIYSGLDGDPENAFYLKLFNADQDAWKALRDAGAAPNIERILMDLGMSDIEAKLATTDVITAIWWSDAMAKYAAALATGKPLESVGKEVAQDANLGYNEPWNILTTWALAGKPSITPKFITSLPQPALGARSRT